MIHKVSGPEPRIKRHVWEFTVEQVEDIIAEHIKKHHPSGLPSGRRMFSFKENYAFNEPDTYELVVFEPCDDK